jgi:hypothetical protein
MNENNFSPKILHPAKLTFRIDRAIKMFHDRETKTVHDQQATTTEDSHKRWKKKKKKNTRGQEASNHSRTKDK